MPAPNVKRSEALRLIIFTASIPAFAARRSPPSDPERMNDFATLWNAYVSKLAMGVLDVALWAKVVSAWERLR